MFLKVVQSNKIITIEKNMKRFEKKNHKKYIKRFETEKKTFSRNVHLFLIFVISCRMQQEEEMKQNAISTKTKIVQFQFFKLVKKFQGYSYIRLKKWVAYFTSKIERKLKNLFCINKID